MISFERETFTTSPDPIKQKIEWYYQIESMYGFPGK